MADQIGAAGQVTAPTAPAQVTGQPTTQVTEPRKFTDEQAADLLKELMTLKNKQKKADDLEAKRIEDAKKANGEFQSLLESEKAKNIKLETTLKDSMLKLAAKSAGLDDLDYLALIDQSKITYGEDFVPIGIQEAVDDLKAKKPALFFGNNPPVPKTPIPTKVGTAGGPGTWADYLKMPQPDRLAFQQKHPEAYALLVRTAKGQ